jgi:hypothetical protein
MGTTFVIEVITKILFKMAKSKEVYRTITVQSKKDNKFIEEVRLNITVTDIKKIVKANDNDKDSYYDTYELNSDQFFIISRHAEDHIVPDFKRNYYLLDCFACE